jgi:hypothetical protein
MLSRGALAPSEDLFDLQCGDPSSRALVARADVRRWPVRQRLGDHRDIADDTEWVWWPLSLFLPVSGGPN